MVVSIGSNTASFIDTTTNAMKHVTYVGRLPHEAFFTPDGKEVWVTVRGEDYLAGAPTHLTLADLNGEKVSTVRYSSMASPRSCKPR